MSYEGRERWTDEKKEHVSLFTVFHLVGGKLHGMWLAFVVPLLALPQVTHYIIDGLIWRRRTSGGERVM